MLAHYSSDTFSTHIEYPSADLYSTYTMYSPADIRSDVLNDIMSSYYLHNYRIFGLNGLNAASVSVLLLLFVYSLDYAHPRLANNVKSAKEGGSCQFNGLDSPVVVLAASTLSSPLLVSSPTAVSIHMALLFSSCCLSFHSVSCPSLHFCLHPHLFFFVIF